MTAFAHHLAYDFKTGTRDRGKLLMYYLFPLVFFALVGGLMAGINPGFTQTMIPALTLFAFMCAGLLSLPGMFVGARESGVFRSYRINGVPSASIIAIPVIGAAVHMVVVSVIIWLAGVRFFGAAVPGSIPGFALAAGLSYLAYAGIGVLIGVAAANATVTTLVGQAIYIPSIVLGGLMVPASVLPSALQRVSLLLPATHCMRLFAGLAGSGGAPGATLGSALVLAASIVVNLTLAAALFEWDSRSSHPSRKAVAALLGVAPFVVAALAGR